MVKHVLKVPEREVFLKLENFVYDLIFPGRLTCKTTNKPFSLRCQQLEFKNSFYSIKPM